MLTNISIKNFKKFEQIDFELGKTIVLIGPNNSGKTAALQALALWDIGLKQWILKRTGKTTAVERPGVTINRRDLVSIPVPDTKHIWRDLHVRNITRDNVGQKTENIRIDIVVSGVTEGKSWKCGLEFDYANDESFYCRPLRTTDEKPPERMPIPSEASNVNVEFLQPMSGLADKEYEKSPGEIRVLLGSGQTAEVIRNLCYHLYLKSEELWNELVKHLGNLFGVELLAPKFYPENGEIVMAYKEHGKFKLDLTSSGRGFQQTLLLLTHLYANPGSVLLLDEPDAHLEILRQRQTYQLLTEVAYKSDSQIIIASHSEVVLREAAERDIVISCVGKPHRINDRGTQVLKALKEIEFDQYYQAEQKGWILYLEGSTDLAILQAFALTLEHSAVEVLERPFICYVQDQPDKARSHFYGLREAKGDLIGVAIFDRIDKELKENEPLSELMWGKRELENYLCLEEVLLSYAIQGEEETLFERSNENIMKQCIGELERSFEISRKPGPWSKDIKASDDFLDPLFENFFEKLGLSNLMRKSNYHELARLVPKEKIDAEVIEKLDAIVKVATKAKPVEL